MGRKKNFENTEQQEEYLSGFPNKWKKHLNPEWVSKIDAMSDEEIKTCLLAAEACIMTTEKDMESDLEIQTLKDELNEKTGSYKDIIIEAKAKSRYLVYVSKERGKAE
jgi:hypothetical protein